MRAHFSKFILSAVLSCNFAVAANANVVNPPFVRPLSTSATQTQQTDSTSSIWGSMSQNFTLDHHTNYSQVQTEIRKLQAHPEGLYHALESSGPYIYYVYQQTKAQGLPAELALLPVIESDYNPAANSRVGAAGLWQLMPKTASAMGVKVKAGYDGRRDVIASTQAALHYLGYLGNHFNGNWMVAIGAYNCGPGKMHSTMHHTGSNTFWNLPLPKETKEYVPKLLAVAAVVQDPQRYGMKLPPVSNQQVFAAVKVDKPVQLAQVAQTTGCSERTLKTLNPDYNRGVVPATNGQAYTLLVPVNKSGVAQAKFADNPGRPTNTVQQSV